MEASSSQREEVSSLLSLFFLLSLFRSLFEQGWGKEERRRRREKKEKEEVQRRGEERGELFPGEDRRRRERKEEEEVRKGRRGVEYSHPL